MTAGRHLLVWSDATELAGAEQAMVTLVALLPPEVRVTVAGCQMWIVDAVAGDRPATDRLLAPRLAGKGDITQMAKVRGLLAEVRPDVIHLNKTEVADLRYVEVLAQLSDIARLVSVVHHVEPPATAPARVLARWLAARATATVAVGPSLAGQLESILGLAAGRVEVIPNALPVFEADRRPASMERADQPRLTVGVLARFVPHKAVDQVVAAVAALDGVRLLVGGEGPERCGIERQVRRLGIGDRVELLGWVSPERVLDHCDALVSAARIEGHPLALLDARRRGIPIVATEVGAVSEIVDHEVTGLLVRPDDVTGLCAGIKRLADDAELRKSMGLAARAQAAASSPAAMAAAYQALYWPSGTKLPAGNRAN